MNMQYKAAIRTVLVFPAMSLLSLFLSFYSVTLMAEEPEKSDPAVQALMEKLAKNEGFKLTTEEINSHNIMGKNFVFILPLYDMQGQLIRGAGGNSDIFIYMKKDSKNL